MPVLGDVSNVVRTQAAVSRIVGDPQVVYDLTVDDAHEFFAAGMLVSNCHDANQYADSVIDMSIRGSIPSTGRRNIVRSHYVYT
jgi:hypothetical protein